MARCGRDRWGRRWLYVDALSAQGSGKRLAAVVALLRLPRVPVWAALGELDGLQVDAELLFAAAMLHDIGLVKPPNGSDFTLSSMRLAREVADEVGLSTDATEVMQTAITLHYTPGVSTAVGPEAYLLSAGAAVDVAGVRWWDLPPHTLTDAVRDYPRLGFKKAFAEAFRAEAARVPRGRVQFLNRSGALIAAINLAPFDE